MQTVTPGASHLEVTPIACGTWQSGGDRESADDQAAVAGLVREGLTRHVGVSNHSTDQITAFAAVLPAETAQPPYHLFRRHATQPRGGGHECHYHEAVEGEIRPR